MNLKPSQTSLAQRLGLPEREQTAAEIIAKMVQVRRDGVCAATEVKVVRQIQSIT